MRSLASACAAGARCLTLLVAVAGWGCLARSDPTADEVPPASRRWVEVFTDSSYAVEVDMGNIVKRFTAWDDEYEIWYRTRHRQPRLRRGEQWNLEFTRSVVRCDSLWYKILSVDLSDRGRRTISQQRTAYWDQPWRLIERASVEQFIAYRACDLARSYAVPDRRFTR